MNGTAPAPSGALSQRHGALLSKTIRLFQAGTDPGSTEAKALRVEWSSAREDEGDRQRLALATMTAVIVAKKFSVGLIALVYGPGHKNVRLADDLLAIQQVTGERLAAFTREAVASLLAHLDVDFSDGPAPSLESDDPDALAASMLEGVEPTRARVGYTAHQWINKTGMFAPFVEREALDLFGDDDDLGAGPQIALEAQLADAEGRKATAIAAEDFDQAKSAATEIAGLRKELEAINTAPATADGRKVELEAQLADAEGRKATAIAAEDFDQAKSAATEIAGLRKELEAIAASAANGHQPADPPPPPAPDPRAGLLTRIAAAVQGKSLRPKAAETLRQRLGAGEDPATIAGVLTSLLKK